MATVVLDTSVVIALLNENDLHHESAVQATSVKHQYLISAVTLSEALIAAFRNSSKVGQHYQRLIIDSVDRVIAVDDQVAVLGAKVRADKKLSLPDALISATAQIMKAQLWSCDLALVKAHSGAKRV